MKAYYRTEIFADNTRQRMKLWEKVVNMGIPEYGTFMFHMPADAWAAEITGFDPKYKYYREFLQAKHDYTYANGKGSRGVYWEWIFESDHIYEVKHRISWQRSERFFCTVDNDGNVIKMEKKEVIECLKRRLALMCLPQRKDVFLMCLTTSPASTCHSVGEKTVP
jgi:hypothetical protein